MIVGTPQRFAVEVEPREVDAGWILGGFRFWLGNVEVGNWDDYAALHLCWGWLKRFASQPPDCVEPAVAACSMDEVFDLIVEPIFGPNGIADPEKQPVPYAYERFHISHLGLSSFDSFIIVLVKDVKGNERCLWRKGNEAIAEQWLEPGEMERIAEEFCERFQEQFGALTEPMRIPDADIEMAHERGLSFYVCVKSEEGDPWSRVADVSNIANALAHAAKASCEASEAGVFVDGKAGGLLYWTSRTPDVFNSSVLQPGHS